MNIKKMLLGLGLVGIIVITFVGSLVAVLVTKYQIPQVALFRKTKLYDNGFNQQAWEGMLEYQDLTENKVAESPVPTSKEIDNITANKLYDNGTQTIVAGNFSYKNWVIDYSKKLNKDPNNLDENQYIIYVDDDGTFADQDKTDDDLGEYPNVISMTFHAEEATFFAGLVSCMYVVTQYPDPADWEVGIWGGTDYPVIEAILSGYEAGIQFFNEYVLGWDNTFNENLEPTIDTVQLIDHQGDTNYEVSRDASKRDDWYSGTFDVDQAGQTQALGLITQGAKVITPVAGTQTINAINEAERANNNSDDEVRVVGMDVDGKKQFPNNQDIFLTSAIKNIQDVVYIDLLEIQAKNNSEQAANKINANSHLGVYYPGVDITPKQIEEVCFKETWGYDSKIPDPNNLSTNGEELNYVHGVGLANPEDNQGLYDEFKLWANDPQNLVTSNALEIINNDDYSDVVSILEKALIIMQEKYDGQIPNKSITFNTNHSFIEGEAYYEWQQGYEK